jgi:hypothetical protein
VHPEFWHVSLPTQPFEQAPQFCGSLVKSAHAVPHNVGVVAAQEIAQVVPLQIALPEPADGPGHGDPQTPPAPHPFWVPGVWQLPPQSSWPDGHMQLPAEHIFPPLHALPHWPQFAGSFEKSAHTPLLLHRV